MKTFIENRYGKNKPAEDDTKISVLNIEKELTKLILSLVNKPETSASEKQAEVFFRKALRDFRKGTRYLR